MEPQSWDVIGIHVRSVRELQGLSQTELASRSGVNISSVFRIEKGKAIRITTLSKIAKGLDILLDGILTAPLDRPESNELVVHRMSKALWYAEQDRRSRIPPDYMDGYQDPAERRRIGHLGFVSWFASPPTDIMKNGPGIMLLEIHGTGFDAYNHQLYEDAVIYALRGKVLVQAKSETVSLEEGDWVGFKSADLISIAPADAPENPTAPPRVLWIGANRFSRRKRTRD